MRFYTTLKLVLTLIAVSSCVAESPEDSGPRTALRYGRPENFKPFHYEYSSEELRDKFSEDMMKRAAKEMLQIEAVNTEGPWKPTWESLDQHKTPEWFRDAKFGIAINWGLYSVPAWDVRGSEAMYPDAYPTWMYDKQSHRDYHARFWGKDFQYDDFFQLFTAKNYDPKTLIALIREAGARYILPFCKHHDGVAWWNSAWTQRNFVQMGPRRDLLTPLVKEARKRDIKVALYCCLEEYVNVTVGDDGKIYAKIWPLGGNPTYRALSDATRYRVSGNIAVKNYYDQYMTPLVKEMIDRFDPDGMWLDGEWATPVETLHGRELMAYMCNKSYGRKEVFVNDRIGKGTRGLHGDFSTSEFHTTRSIERPWEEIRSISQSYAFNHEDTDKTVLSRQQLVHMLVDIVANNGNLLLIVGPDRTGRIPELQLDRLEALGHWLKVNGEAIYGTRILSPYRESDVYYTRSKNGQFAYAICTKWPGQRLKLSGVRAETGTAIRMIGVDKVLEWRQDKNGLEISIPEFLQEPDNRPCEYAWSIKIVLRPKG